MDSAPGSKPRIIAVSLLAFLVWMPGCRSGSIFSGISDMRSVALVDYGITFKVPGEWDVSLSRDRYFQFVAVHMDGSLPVALVEYRGLETEPRDQRARELYASGWYNAMPLNYPGWKYVDKGKDDDARSFTFEGAFLDGTTQYLKLGKLKFRDRRIHAIYYTAPTDEMDHYRDIFETIDTLIEYTGAHR